MVSKNVKIIIGSILAIVGVIALAQGMGYIDLPFTSGFSTLGVTGNRVGISVASTKVTRPAYLSTVGTGYEYKWKITASNTGNVAWNTGWIKVRLGTVGSTAVSTTCAANPASCPGGTVGGSFWVEKCSLGTDIQGCREDIVGAWGFKYSTDGVNWLSCPDYLEKVCSIDVGVVSPGASKTIWTKLKVPSAATQGNYPLMAQAWAWADATYAIAGMHDTLTVGTITGNLVITMMGLLSLFGAAISYGWAFV